MSRWDPTYSNYIASKIDVILGFRKINLNHGQRMELIQRILAKPTVDVIREAYKINPSAKPNKVKINSLILRDLDPSLKHLSTFRDERIGVFQVSYKGHMAVLKVTAKSHPWAYGCIENEIKILRLLTDCPGTPKLIKVYKIKHHSTTYRALLREFISGSTLSRKRTISKKDINNLTKLVKSCHRRGVARLDIFGDNVVYCRDKCFLIDFGSAIKKSDLPIERFNYFKKTDMADIKWLPRLLRIKKI